MKKAKEIILKVWRNLYVKYALVVVIGVLFVGVLDDNSVWAHMRNKQRINELEEEIEKYDADYKRDQAQIRELDRNPKAMEKIARERYFMKADDEDIFVLSDDNRQTDPKPQTEDGTAQ